MCIILKLNNIVVVGVLCDLLGISVLVNPLREEVLVRRYRDDRLGLDKEKESGHRKRIETTV